MDIETAVEIMNKCEPEVLCGEGYQSVRFFSIDREIGPGTLINAFDAVLGKNCYGTKLEGPSSENYHRNSMMVSSIQSKSNIILKLQDAGVQLDHPQPGASA